MKIYTCTMINDEQRYLDEWIQYHLNIGFDKIILFEDFNSHPHDISKYGDRVILHKIPDCFNEEENKYFKDKVYRYSVVWNCFNRLYRNECDWSIMLDLDEFIEINNLKKIILFNSNIPQISLKWKIYTYSGHISDPYPNQIYSVRDTYKEFDLNSCISHVKTFFNMNSNLIPSTFHNAHNIPHLLLKDTYVLYNVYCAHYFTKSLDEYMTKLYDAGLMCDVWWQRKVETFFKVNHLNMDDYKDYLKKWEGRKVKINN